MLSEHGRNGNVTLWSKSAMDDMPDSELMAFCRIVVSGLGQLFPENRDGIDTGGGFGERDIWVKYGDREFILTVRESIVSKRLSLESERNARHD